MGSSISPPNVDDYSEAVTVIPFPHPASLLRGPIEAGPADDPSTGPYLLAFENRDSWATAYNSCKAQITSQCESGARIGCSISASSKCKPPWWKFLLGQFSKQDFSERAECEEREMEACFVTAKEKCGVFAKQKCSSSFKNARIKARGLDWRQVDTKEVYRLISTISYANKEKYRGGIWELDKCWGEFRCKYEVTNVRGMDLLGSNEVEIEDYLRKCS